MIGQCLPAYNDFSGLSYSDLLVDKVENISNPQWVYNVATGQYAFHANVKSNNCYFKTCFDDDILDHSFYSYGIEEVEKNQTRNPTRGRFDRKVIPNKIEFFANASMEKLITSIDPNESRPIFFYRKKMTDMLHIERR